MPTLNQPEAEMREAARQFHNLTQGDNTVIIRAPSAEKRDAIIAAGERLRAALATPPASSKAAVSDAVMVGDEQVEANAFDWLETEISGVSCWHHGDPSFEHDANWMKDRALKLIADARKAFPVSAADNEIRQALRACIDVMLHNGIPTDNEHPARIALDDAEAALARPEARGEPVAWRWLEHVENLGCIWQYAVNKPDGARGDVAEPLYTTPQPKASSVDSAVPSDGVQYFNYLCSLLPEGFFWSDPLTPGVLRDIASSVAATVGAAVAVDAARLDFIIAKQGVIVSESTAGGSPRGCR